MDLDREAVAELTEEQLRRVLQFGERRNVRPGDILFRPGERGQNLVVIESGSVEIERPETPDAPAAVLVTHGPGRFLGELNLLTGQTTYLAARVAEAGRVILVSPDGLRRLMAQDAEIARQLMRTFIARRAALRTGEGARSLEILGSRWSRESNALRSWVARQQIPHLWVELDAPEGTALAAALNVTALDLPVVVVPGSTDRNVSPARLAAMLGLDYGYHEPGDLRDLVVVGAGPAGLAATVCAASEGLDTLLLEGATVGGQAAASSLIENYVGFPYGISGGDLAARALLQAQKFGARLASPSRADDLGSGRGHVEIALADGSRIHTRTAIVATGARYGTLPLTGWSHYEGTSIFYAATELEARACNSAPVVVVGGANSAGQAAIFLAEHGSDVTLAVRGGDVTQRMSRYLVDRVEAHPRIHLRTETTVVALHGSPTLDSATLQTVGGPRESVPCRALFCFIGALPATSFLRGVACDEHGFVRTGDNLEMSDLDESFGLLDRPPLPFETSIPGVFAAGDVRLGSAKRVAAAVGEGSAAVASVHKALVRSRTL